jgi:hypothetical protein
MNDDLPVKVGHYILNVHWSVMRGKTIYTKPILGKIKCNLCLKKKQAKKLIFASEIALRV